MCMYVYIYIYIYRRAERVQLLLEDRHDALPPRVPEDRVKTETPKERRQEINTKKDNNKDSIRKTNK